MNDTPLPDASEVIAAEDRLRVAMLASDVAALDALIDHDLIFVGPEGTVVGKAMDLEAHRSGSIRFLRLDPSERHVQVWGEVAVVNVRMEAAASVRGSTTEMALRYTRVWRRLDGIWRVVAGSVVAITAT